VALSVDLTGKGCSIGERLFLLIIAATGLPGKGANLRGCRIRFKRLYTLSCFVFISFVLWDRLCQRFRSVQSTRQIVPQNDHWSGILLFPQALEGPGDAHFGNIEIVGM